MPPHQKWRCNCKWHVFQVLIYREIRESKSASHTSTVSAEKTASDIIAATGVNPDTRVKDLTEEDVAKLREYIDHHVKVEGDLRRDTAFDIKRLIEIGSYRGIRHRKGLPVRGQTSKNNARTRKGPKKTIANKKK